MSDQQNPQQLDLALDPVTGEIDPTEAILQRWEDPDEKQASEDPEEATADVTEETNDVELDDSEEIQDDDDLEDDTDLDEDIEDDTEETEDEDDGEAETIELSDDTMVEVVVSGETQQVSVGDLKRLAGQEKSLTQKSQEVSRLRKEAVESSEKSHLVLQKLIEKAEAEYKPYADVDMLVASKTMADNDFAALRKEAQLAKANLDFLKEEADGFYRGLQQQQQKSMQEAATECVKTLQDELPNWSNQLYNDIRAYAVSHGLPQEQVDTFVDPNVIMLINKARMFDEGRKVATVKKKTPKKRVLKSKRAPATPAQRRNEKTEQVRKRLHNSVSQDRDDIADLIMSRWEN